MLHVRTQAPAALQVTVPLAGAVQTVQLLPHDVIAVLPLITQVAVAPVPHWWYPVVQLTPQASGVPLQVAVPFVGTVHGVQAAVVAVVSQVRMLLFIVQVFPQR